MPRTRTIHYVVPLLGVAVTMTLFSVIVARFRKYSSGVLTINVSRTDSGFLYSYTNMGALTHVSRELTVLSTASVTELYQTDATNQGFPLLFHDSVRAEYLQNGQTIGKDAYASAIETSTKGLSVRLQPLAAGEGDVGAALPRSVETTKELLQAVATELN